MGDTRHCDWRGQVIRLANGDVAVLQETRTPKRRKNPVTATATAAQVFEKARQHGFPTEGVTAQQLVDAMWPAGEVRLRGSGSKTTLRGRTHSAMTERRMVGNPRGGRKAAPKKLKDVQYTAKGQPFVVLANGQHRFISRAAAGVTHEDLVDAGLRRNPGLVWKESSGALVALGKGNKTRYMIDENYGHKDTGYLYVLHVSPTLGGKGTTYAAKTIDHAKEMAEASEDPSLRKNPNLRRNHHLQPGDAFVTPEGRYGWVTGAPVNGRYPVKWQGGSKGTVKDTLSAAVPI